MKSQTGRKTNEMPDYTKRRLRVQKTSPVWNETKTSKITLAPVFSGNSRKSLRLSMRVISSQELGTMSKNNLRRITLVRGPIWRIHSLTLIISWINTFLREQGWRSRKSARLLPLIPIIQRRMPLSFAACTCSSQIIYARHYNLHV